MAETVRTACVQLNCGPVIADNLAPAEALVRAAAADGAQFVCTPENTCHIRAKPEGKLQTCQTQDSHIALAHHRALAQELGIWLLIGSLSIKIAADKVANRSFLIGPDGEIVSTYDKIHLFDVDLPTGESHRESATVQPGTKAVVAPTPWGGLGLGICYDIRFAYLYRKLAQAGAAMLTAPSAFTVPTGKAHWEILLRARAIETGSFMLAPAQCGEHEGGRRTWGHSMMIGPWGDVLAVADDKPGYIVADLDLSAVVKARAAIPALKHDREIAA